MTPERSRRERSRGERSPGERSRGERTTAVLLALVAGLLGLLAASRTWVTADVTDALAGRLHLRLSGRQVAPVVPAVSVVLLAAGVAALLARRLGRAVTGLVLVLGGGACAAAAFSAVRAPQGAVAAEVARATGRSGGPSAPGASLAVTHWPWLAVLAGAVAVVAGAFVVVGARRWAQPSERFESPVDARVSGVGSSGGGSSGAGARGAGARGARSSVAPASAAESSSASGARSSGAPGPGSSGAGSWGAGARSSGAPGPGSSGARSSLGEPPHERSERAAGDTAEPADAWDALSRGEDPTR